MGEKREIPNHITRAVNGCSVLLILGGLPFVLGFLCLGLVAVLETSSADVEISLGSFTISCLTIGCGGVLFWHTSRLLRGKPSSLLRLPPVHVLLGVFGVLIVIGLVVYGGRLMVGLVFPPILVAAAALPPLWAVAWFMAGGDGTVTWRRAAAALVGGATVSVILALLLNALLSWLLLALVTGLAPVAPVAIERVIEALAGQRVARAAGDPGFVYFFVQVAVLVPVVEEFAKPLIVLPLIGRRTRRDAFLIGALAGVGFAALENVLYGAGGGRFWAGILALRALGGALHPLTSGVVTAGWWRCLHGEARSATRWVLHFGLAAAIHALWNGGIWLVITLAGIQVFGPLSGQVDVLGVSVAVVTLAVLIVLGLGALWAGRSIFSQGEETAAAGEGEVDVRFALSDRAIAIWGVICLAALLPLGIAGLKVLLYR